MLELDQIDRKMMAVINRQEVRIKKQRDVIRELKLTVELLGQEAVSREKRHASEIEQLVRLSRIMAHRINELSEENRMMSCDDDDFQDIG